jgi:hypothetical protein
MMIETLKAIAGGRQELTDDVKKAIELGLAKKVESAFTPRSHIALTDKGVAALGVL